MSILLHFVFVNFQSLGRAFYIFRRFRGEPSPRSTMPDSKNICFELEPDAHNPPDSPETAFETAGGSLPSTRAGGQDDMTPQANFTKPDTESWHAWKHP